jgi:hypothetical protein
VRVRVHASTRGECQRNLHHHHHHHHHYHHHHMVTIVASALRHIMYTHQRASIRAHVHMHTCTHAHMHTCTHAYTPHGASVLQTARRSNAAGSPFLPVHPKHNLQCAFHSLFHLQQMPQMFQSSNKLPRIPQGGPPGLCERAVPFKEFRMRF